MTRGGAPMRLDAKWYYAAGTLAGLIAIFSVVLALINSYWFSLLVAAFWAVVSVLAFRAARRGPAI
jgi:hypothetical protein